MEARADEIAAGVYRISTFLPDIAPPTGFTVNQFLVAADEPLLFHCGPRALFGLVREAVERIVPVESIRWLSFGHVESDECGAMNEWLAVAPRAQVAFGALGCMVSINDLADRPPRPLADGEVMDLGGKRVRHLDTPHVPHNWEAGLIYEETSRTLLCGDLFTQLGDGDALVERDLIEPSIHAERVFHASSLAPTTCSTIRSLAELSPITLGCMHGSSYGGDGGGALRGLADAYEHEFLEKA